MPSLHIVDVQGKTSTFILERDETTIGRFPDNDIPLTDDHRVSRYHARITREGNAYILNDLGSHNGTKLNNEKIKRVELNHNDLITIGACSLYFLDTPQETEQDVTRTFHGLEDDKEPTQTLVMSSVSDGCESLEQTLLMSTPVVSLEKTPAAATAELEEIDTKDDSAVFPRKDVKALERNNKVLYILFEISRQMTTIHEFDEVLEKIMALTFQVVDADAGFLFLKDELEADDPQPAVVKLKDKDDIEERESRASRTILRKVISEKVGLLTTDAMADSRFEPTESLIRQKIRSSICVPLWSKDDIIGVIQLNSSSLHKLFSKEDLELVKSIGCQMAMVIEQSRLNERIRTEEKLIQNLQRFHSPQVIDMILEASRGARDDFLEPKELRATILFADIVGFSSFAEGNPPRLVSTTLNHYFERMTEIVFEHEGTLDKYLGDGLMAVFGAPLGEKDDAERAVTAAIRMRRELQRLFEEKAVTAKFDMRFGINTGTVVAGNLGSTRRMDYTVIGDAVNTAARLEAAAETNQILIGEATRKNLGEAFKLREIGPRTLKGKKEKIVVFEVLDG